MLTITEVERLTGAPKVEVKPSTVTLYAGGTQQFNGTLYGSETVDIRWSTAPSGTIGSKTGLYTAPSSVVSDSTFDIVGYLATSPDVSGSASVTIKNPVDIYVKAEVITKWCNTGQTTPYIVSEVLTNPTGISCYVGGPLPSTTVTDARYVYSDYIKFSCYHIDTLNQETNLSVTGSIDTNCASGLSTEITNASGIATYTMFYTDTASGHTGYPTSVAIGPDVIKLNVDTGYGIIPKYITVSPIRSEVLRATTIPRVAGVDLVDVNHQYDLRYFNQDNPSTADPTVSYTSLGDGTYTPYTLTTCTYTPSGCYETITASMADDSGESVDYLYYQLRVDGFTPTSGAAGTSVTITGGNFNPSIFIILNNSTRVNEYTISGDGKSLTFVMPSFTMEASGYSYLNLNGSRNYTKSFAGPIRIKLYYCKLTSGDEAGSYLVKNIDTPFILS